MEKDLLPDENARPDGPVQSEDEDDSKKGKFHIPLSCDTDYNRTQMKTLRNLAVVKNGIVNEL